MENWKLLQYISIIEKFGSELAYKIKELRNNSTKKMQKIESAP